jgi:CxxC-x17-CxxC domain-containing protein
MEFVDRLLTCADCGQEFIFTAGEQLFFFDKQFKNDPKRCKPCKSKRAGAGARAAGTGPAAAGISRTETRTTCSECGVETTVPFKPTQGRPVLCRQCFQNKRAAAPAVTPATATTTAATAMVATGTTTTALVAAASAPPISAEVMTAAAHVPQV